MRMYDGVYRDWYMYKSTSVPQRVVAYWLDDNEQLVALQLFDVRLQTAVEYRVINVETDVNITAKYFEVSPLQDHGVKFDTNSIAFSLFFSANQKQFPHDRCGLQD